MGEAENGRRAVPLIHEARPDVVFLDVQMPGLDGFDTLDLLAPPRPHVVFVTAYDEHAVRAFEVHALDYLTKPVRAARLAATLLRLADLQQRPDPAQQAFEADREREQEDAPLRRLALPAGRRLRVVELDEVAYFEAREKLVFAHVGGRDHPVDFTLQALEKRLDPDAFCRVHRAFLVNVGAVRELMPWVGRRTRCGWRAAPRYPSRGAGCRPCGRCWRDDGAAELRSMLRPVAACRKKPTARLAQTAGGREEGER